MTFEEIETAGVEAWLAGLREDLVSKMYRPDPVRRVMIPNLRRRRLAALAAKAQDRLPVR